MTHEIRPDLNGSFNRLIMSNEAEKLSMQVSPLFFAYLQNKIATYAEAAIENVLPYDPDPTRQVKAIVEHERLKNYVSAYKELMAELTEAAKSTQPDSE